jgi:outer membrane protein, heavy metal efflux system
MEMFMKRTTLFPLFSMAALCVTAVTAVTASASEPVPALTMARVIAIASEHAPEARLASTRIAEEEARVAGAGVRALENPKLSLAAGPRSGGEASGLDTELGLEVPFELRDKRGKRTALAKAALRRETYVAANLRREGVTGAVQAYLGVLHAEERLRLAGDRRKVAEELLQISKERHRAGDVAKFEVNVAMAEVAGAESEVAAAKGKVAVARGTLAQKLGLRSGRDLVVAGELRDRSFFDSVRSAVATTTERDDLQAARAGIDAARAAVILAEADRTPDLALSLSYKREGNENVALGGVSMALPIFNPRKAELQVARVQHQRAQLSAELAEASIAAEVDGARNAYDAAVEAVGRIEREGLPLQQENVMLAGESYRAGKINLSTLLQVRRDALEIKREHLERLTEAADAGVALASATGAWTAGR